jgi:hypothetical protein
MKSRKTSTTEGLVGIAMHVLLAVLFWCNAKVWIPLLHILHHLLSDRFKVSLRKSTRRNKSDHLVHEPLHNAHAELKVDNCIGEVETSNVNAHSGLRVWDSGCGVRLGDSVPRLRVFFVDSGCDKGRNYANRK